MALAHREVRFLKGKVKDFWFLKNFWNCKFVRFKTNMLCNAKIATITKIFAIALIEKKNATIVTIAEIT